MFDIIHAKEQFTKLSKEQKFIKLQAMFSLVKSSLGTYSDILQHLSLQWSTIPEQTLVWYHDLLLADISLLQGDSLDLFVDELKKFQNELQKTKISSSTIKDQTDADQLLQNLYI